MQSCDGCKFLRDRQVFTVPATEQMPALNVKQGWCHRAEPTVISPTQSAWPPVQLTTGWCGEFRWSWRGLFRAIFKR